MNTIHDPQAISDHGAGRTAIAPHHNAGSKLGAFRHLLWKEYRSIRLFWISMLALTVAIQLLLLLFSQDKNETVLMIYHFALGAPAFFAVGAAGAAFAAEKEEGTFDFLRASPIRPGPIVASKLVVVFLGTAALFAALWPIAYLLVGQQLPDGKVLPGLLGLWLVGAVEGIAWGTLFSLLGARPLLAIVLAMAAGSTCAHLISWRFRAGMNLSFDLLSYYYSAPWRMLLALAILIVDTYFGLHWLAGGLREARRAGHKLLALAATGQSVGESAGADSTRVSERLGYIRRSGGDSLPPSSLAPADREGETQEAATPHLAAASPYGPGALPTPHPSPLPQGERGKFEEFRALLVKRSRAAMLGRLLWQHWWQSWPLMVVMSAVFVVFGSLSSVVWSQIASGRMSSHPGDHALPLWSIGIFSTLIGAMVFLSDQERRNYQFFAEHNVPPRFVWITRQLPWMLVVSLWAIPICYAWLVTTSNIGTLWSVIRAALRLGYYNFEDPRSGNYLYLPPIDLGLCFAMVGYAAGQWASMLIRSGVMAGFVGLLLSAALCGWTLLMHTMRVGFWWSVLPIPVVLLLATWLRAPDWISENKRTGARMKIAVTVLLPAIVLMIAVPYYRVHQIPKESPGFDVDQHEVSIKTNLEAGLATAKLYQQAQAAYRSMDWGLDGLPGVEHLDESLQVVIAAHRAEIEAELKRSTDKGDDSIASLFEIAVRYSSEIGQVPTELEKKWLGENQQTLDLLIRAAERENCLFFDPANGVPRNIEPADERAFLRLMLTSARQLEGEGKLDEALDRYFQTLRMIGDLYSSHVLYLPDRQMTPDVRRVFLQIANWAGKPGQTQDRLRAAIARLESSDAGALRMKDFIKNNFILARRLVGGDAELNQYFYPSNDQRQLQDDTLWSTLMPWEVGRALRVLNVISNWGLNQYRDIGTRLAEQGNPADIYNRGLEFEAWQAEHVRSWLTAEESINDQKFRLAEWISTTSPDLFSILDLNFTAAAQTIHFTAQKRGAMLALAITAYRLEHGELPKSLAILNNDYFTRQPIDPYSGYAFRYFPHGIPEDGTEEAANPSTLTIGQYFGGPDIMPSSPGVWCTSALLTVLKDEVENDATSDRVNPDRIVRIWQYNYRLDNGREMQIPTRRVWQYGSWFPIPSPP